MKSGVKLSETEILKRVADLEIEEKKRRAREDIIYFAEEILGYKNAWFHNEWYKTLMDPSKQYIIRLAPRRHAKSTIHTEIYPLWEIIRNPNVRILICSSTGEQAKDFLRSIKAWLTSPQMAMFNLVPRNPEVWSAKEIIVNRTTQERNPTVFTAGATGAVVGARADIIIMDDIVDEENSSTPGMREKLRMWLWKTMWPILEPTGRMCMIGTRYHWLDLYGELLSDPRFHPEVWKAIINEDTKEVLWPEVLPYEKLMEFKESMPMVAFMCAYQNDVAAMQEGIFSPDDIQYFIPEDVPANAHTFMGVDPAISERDRRAYFAITVVDRVEEKKGDGESAISNFVRKTYRARLSMDAQADKVVEYIRAYKPEVVGIEAIAYQDALRQEVEKRVDKEGLDTKVKAIRTSEDKFRRFIRLARDFENHRIWLRRDQQELIEEILSYPRSTTVDLIDALDLAITASDERVSSGFELI